MGNRGRKAAIAGLVLASLFGTTMERGSAPVAALVPGDAVPAATLERPAPSSTQLSSGRRMTAAQATDTIETLNESLPSPLVQVLPPEEFAAFLEPQRTLADVYFGGRFALSTFIIYTPTTVEFDQPAVVVDALPDVLGRPTLVNHLTGPIPSHPELVCVRPGQPLCGRLEPSFIGVIFDETRFRVDVFVHPDLRAPPAEADARYLPPPDTRGPTLVQNLSANYSGNETGEDSFSLFGHTRVGLGTRHIFSDWFSHEEQSLSIETLGYQEDLSDHQIKAGLYEPTLSVLRAMRHQPMAGVSMARSFHARTDIASIIASDIDLFLATRSQVDLLRDGRLYDSRFYESGNQRLDTSRLPAGAYTLQIRITDASGATRLIERFYVKSSLLAPPGHDIWFAELGRVMDRTFNERLPDDGGALLGRGGYQHRVNSKLGIGVAGAVAEDEMLGELNSVWVEPNFEMSGELFASTDGAAGWGLRGLGRFGSRTGASLNLLRVWPEVDAEEEYQLLRDEVMQRSLQVNRQLRRGLLVAALSESQSNDGPVNRSQSLQYSLPFVLSGQDQFTFSAQLARVDGDLQGQLSLAWRRNAGRWQYQVTPRAQYRDSDRDVDAHAEGLAASASATWRDGSLFHDDMQFTALVDADSEQVNTALLGEHASQYGRGRVAMNRVDTGSDRNTLSSAAYDTNLVATRGRVAFGGPELSEGAVLLDLTGAPDAAFDVLVDSQRKYTVRGDSRSVVALPPYHTYRVLLRDVGTDYVRYDDTAREATLYPGHVSVMDWQAAGILIAVGRLMTPTGACATSDCEQTLTPLGSVILEGTEGVTVTDPDGFFQGEVLTSTTELKVQREDLQCTLNISRPRIVNGIALLGDLVCREN